MDFYHLIKVLRAKPGDIIELSDNECFRYLTQLEEIQKDKAVLLIKEKYPICRRSPSVYLFQCILKKEAMELAIQKTVEIGVDCIIPIISERVVVKLDEGRTSARVLRWQQIASEASKQCKRDFECRILNPAGIVDIKTGDFGVFFAPVEVAILQESKKNPESLENISRVNMGIDLHEVEKIAYIIGPEGGFEEKEISLLAKNNALLVNFGNNILRAETAAIYFLSILDYLIKKN